MNDRLLPWSDQKRDRDRSIPSWTIALSILLLCCPLIARQGEEGPRPPSATCRWTEFASRAELFSDDPEEPNFDGAECDPDQPDHPAALKRESRCAERIAVVDAGTWRFAGPRGLDFRVPSRGPPGVRHRLLLRVADELINTIQEAY